jgi:hypothetical protein
MRLRELAPGDQRFIPQLPTNTKYIAFWGETFSRPILEASIEIRIGDAVLLLPCEFHQTLIPAHLPTIMIWKVPGRFLKKPVIIPPRACKAKKRDIN